MINSYYTGALQAFVAMGEHLEKDMTEYRELLDKSIDYMENQLYDGEYFIQNIRWKELQASDPTKVQSVNSNYSKEGLDLLEKEGIAIPKEGWTLEEFYTICQKVTRDTDGDGELDQFGSTDYSWREALAAHGGPAFPSGQH